MGYNNDKSQEWNEGYAAGSTTIITDIKLDNLSHANHEMLRYIKQGIGVYNVRPPTLMDKWEKMVDSSDNWKCFYENRYRKTMDLLKELNPEVYYNLLDERDKRDRV